MTQIKGHDYTCNQSWIEFKAPNAQGVYCLLDKDGKVIFIGKGNIRERLLRHWNQENSGDARIWSHAPAFSSFPEGTELERSALPPEVHDESRQIAWKRGCEGCGLAGRCCVLSR